MQAKLWLGFVALCLLEGSGWLVNSYWPSPMPPLAGQALRDGLLAILFLPLHAVWRRKRPSVASTAATSPSWQTLLAIALWAGLLLVLSGALAGAAVGKVSGFTAELTTTLTPAMLVFMAAQQESGFGLAGSDSTLLLPALVGFGGAALLLPYSLPASAAGYLWLSALVVAAGVSGWAILRLHGLLETWSVLQMAGVFAAGAAVLAWVGHTCLREGVGIGLGGQDRMALTLRELAVAVLLDAPSLLLTVWLLGRLRPVRFVLFYLVVPLVSVAEAFVLMRPATDWSFSAGVLILLGSVGVMLQESRTLKPAG